MIIAICKDCGKKLEENGAIVIPPPSRPFGDTKLHQCVSCYDRIQLRRCTCDVCLGSPKPGRSD